MTKVNGCQAIRLKTLSKKMLQGIGPWVRKILWRRKWQPTTVFLPGRSHGQRTQWATVHAVAEESHTT